VPDLSALRRERPWFRAKRFGWGWGWPCAWQGWAVMALHLAAVYGAVVLFEPPVATIVSLVASATLIAVAWRTSDRPRWRWGDEVDAPRGPFVRGGGGDTQDVASISEKLEGRRDRRRQARRG
jgi:hypothetical protein